MPRPGRAIHGPGRKKGRWFDEYLKVSDWTSEYESVQRLLNHLARKTKSESSRRHYLETLAALCRREKRTPDQLVRLSRSEVQDAVQGYVDHMSKLDRSIRYVNTSLAKLVTFFRINGFKNNRELDIERYHLPTRYRKRPEYIPAQSEARNMVIAGKDPKEKAVVLVLYEGGFRNATARAIRYADIREELDAGFDVVHVPVRASMKEVDPDAAKGMLEYDTFVGREAASAVREYLKWFEERYGRSLPVHWPLFPGQRLDGEPMKRTTLEALVKRLARTAGIERWADVYPHCLRKAFESSVRNSGLDWKDQEFFMGHVLPGSMDTYFDKTKTEEFREKYRRVRFFANSSVTRDEMLDAMRKEILALAGYTEGEMEQMGDLSRHSKEEMDQMIDRKWQERMGLKDGQTQKVVAQAEVRKHIGDGWEFVSWLDDQRSEAIVKLPSK